MGGQWKPHMKEESQYQSQAPKPTQGPGGQEGHTSQLSTPDSGRQRLAQDPASPARTIVLTSTKQDLDPFWWEVWPGSHLPLQAL